MGTQSARSPRRSAFLFAGFSAFALIGAATGDAQPAIRRATNLTTLLAFPGFFHGRPIVIVGPNFFNPSMMWSSNV